MIGNFFAAASCFWHPASDSAARAQASIVEPGKENSFKALTGSGRTEGVAFLLMVPSTARAAPVRQAPRTIARIVDLRKKKTSVLPQGRTGYVQATVPSRPNCPAMVPT
ncbi:MULTISPECIES: hypothetical protein [unclassified Mesorhizobium]|uniref:hypothetical protein n=1 Tax=unclassified Mesorhizobium TaxID=325217 RepID=UPI001FE0CEE6|nr:MULTISPECIES: hypothetical protein [unclassified Mesorhizobium]